MKKITFFKTLLVAAGLLGGSNAWAQTTLWEKGTEGHAWEDADAIKFNEETAPNGWVMETNDNLSTDLEISKDESSNPIGLKISHSIRKAYFKATKAMTTQDGSILTLNAVWNTGSSTGGSGNYNYIKFGDVEIRALGQDQKCQIVIGGVVTDFGNKSDSRGGDITISLTINKVSKAVDYTLACNSGKTGSGIISDTDFDSFEMGYVYVTDPKNRQAINHTLKSITITEEVPSAASVDYTINYQLSGITVKSVEGTGLDEAEITAETAIDGEGDYADIHYLITAAEAPSLTLDANGTNVLNVPVRAPYTATLSVTTTVNGVSTVSNIPLTETDDKVCSWSRKWSLYTQKDGVYYKIDDTSKFSESGTFTDGETISKTDVYSTAESDIVYFAEVENLSNNLYADENSAYSGGGSAMISGSKVAWLLNLPAAYYNITGYELEDDKVFRGMTLRKSNSAAADQVIVDVTSQTDHIMSGNFILTQTTGVNLSGTTLSNKVNQSVRLDYIIIRKIGDVIVSSANLEGYKTFYNATKNFEVDANTTIYKAAAPDNGYVTITAVEGSIIPAATPVFLKTSDTESYAITLTETAETGTGDFDGNALQAATSGTIDGAYILAYTTADGLGIYQFTGSLDAGDVYLTAAGQGAKLRFGFADDATAIKTVAVEAADNAAIYNLSGQRVNAAYKGIVIKNGKKYLNK